MDTIAIGNMLRNARIEKQMRQSDVASKVGMTASNYARYERGVYPNMPIDKLAEIAKVLEIPGSLLADVLMGNSDGNNTVLSKPTRIKIKESRQSDIMDNKNFTLESLRDNPPRKYAASSSAKINDDDAEYLRKQLEEINEEEARGDWE